MSATTKEKIKKPRSKRKVLLMAAEDALKMLRYINPTRGVYIRLTQDKSVMAWCQNPAELQRNIPKIAKGCEVCAKGALLLGYVHLFDGVDGLSSVSRLTREAFGSKQADLIESVFEDSDRFGRAEYPEWGKGPRERLRHILKNIIAHKGVFRPEVAPGKEPKK